MKSRQVYMYTTRQYEAQNGVGVKSKEGGAQEKKSGKRRKRDESDLTIG